MTVTQLGYEECLGRLGDDEVVDAMASAFVVADRPGVARCQMSTTSGPDLVFGHASVLPGLGLCVKAGVQVPGNRARGLDPVQAAVVLHDAETGVPCAVLDGRAVTTLRTAGALVAGVRAIGTVPRPRVAVLGFGAQGRMVARLAASVLDAAEVRVHSRSLPAVPPGVVAADSVENAVRDADVVACCTSASEPVVTAAMLQRDVVVASMGSYAPELCEVDPEVVRRSTVVAADVTGEGLGPLARLRRADVPHPVVQPLGDLPDGAVTTGTRCAFIGGTGVQDALAAWSILLGWPQVAAVVGQYADPRSGSGSSTAGNL